MTEVRGVEPGFARRLGVELGVQDLPDHDDRLCPDARAFDQTGDFRQAAAQDPLVWPGRPLHYGGRGRGGVAPGQQLGHGPADQGGAQVEAEGGTVAGELPQLFTLRHRGAPRGAGEDDALGHPGHRQFHPECRAGGKGGADPRHDLIGYALLPEDPSLLVDRPEERQGEDASFYFEPVTLSPVAGQAIGTGDGTTTTFPFTVSIGGYTLSPANISAPPNIYLNGALQSSGFTVNATALAPTVTFATAPTSGIVVSADFHWYFLCRFDDDSEDVEEFMSEFYTLQSLRLRTVRS